MKNLIILFGIASILSFVSCKKEGTITPVEQLHLVTLDVPNGFPQLILNPSNPLSEEGIALGRKLYYDPILSNTGQSCSSCHFQSNSFSHPTANSLAHVNLAWHESFLWNGSVAGTLEDAMLFEVNDFFATNLSNLQQHESYPEEFKKVFGSDVISSHKVAFALAQFVRSMISAESRFDKYLKGEIMLSSSEMNGMDIFLTERGDCFHCHSVGLLTDNSFHNTGLDNAFTSVNWGRYQVTGNSTDIGKYKTPTIRNIELSAPYMHDGRFLTLEEVVEFYNSGVQITSHTDPIMTKPGKEFGLQLSTQDKADLVAFLKALTDTSFINNPDLSHP